MKCQHFCQRKILGYLLDLSVIWSLQVNNHTHELSN